MIDQPSHEESVGPSQIGAKAINNLSKLGAYIPAALYLPGCHFSLSLFLCPHEEIIVIIWLRRTLMFGL